MKHLALLMIFQIGFLDCYLLRSFKQCQTQTSKEIFYASLPSSFCDKNFALPFYTPDVVGNYEPFPSPPPGGEKTIVLGAALKFDMIEYGMSMTTSDTIPLDRDVKDLREPGCKNWNYPSNLPSTSVVIAFHNEGLSVLIRTIVSVLNRSPTKVLKEIVLVDDFSNINEFPHLGSELEDWIKKTNKVRISRNKKREGLIVSKNLGVLQATGEVVVFLDAHCEVGLNWLPPLLTPILRDPATLTVPIVYPIDHTDFSSRSVYARSTKPIGIWEWGLLYKELHPVLAESQENLTSPYPSPLHAGGLIAFNKEYFLSVGGYDPGLKVWGGEQCELSFKIWMFCLVLEDMILG
ncbi:N-acetylgalactosaminyltransferase 7 [Eurytemora carolleeae]|uniref:N-acetylgalactosaminyltransferase 7 n=1 Tax=Eurytemora carolleeae TaxID=1294199 RepID=UPI000C77F857|nr:N-acetylgalactosaminyltransferase 7 [Eurytemora carolleeae]|eukprot:XP_023319675.1 N-acetylgalactosaminyltransferase 7-like [Eurytemora affinis]